ncbi:MAG: hypothetical protein ACRC1H_03895, partial [Caldilineaceae bacterium]
MSPPPRSSRAAARGAILTLALPAALLFALALLLVSRTEPIRGDAMLVVAPAQLSGDAPVQVTTGFTVSLPIARSESLATVIAASGHGQIHLRNGRTSLSTDLVRMIQEAILRDLFATDVQQYLAPDVQTAVADAQALLLAPTTTAGEAVYLRGAIAGALLDVSAPTVVEVYGWRSAALVTRQIGSTSLWSILLSADVRRVLQTMNFFDPPAPSSAYIERCRAESVPIPPDWAPSGSAWSLQGSLATNMLQPGGAAQVWTWSDPTVAGACIFLARGTGAAGSPAGIICQSATTGHACFWDNKLRAEEPERVLGW